MRTALNCAIVKAIILTSLSVLWVLCDVSILRGNPIMADPILITSALPYANGSIHLGHLGNRQK